MTNSLINPNPGAVGRVGRALLRRLGVHPNDAKNVKLDLHGYSALCIATNHGVLDIGVPTGVFGSELTVPYYCFLDAGMRVDLASPRGGVIPVEPLSMKALIRTANDDRMLADADIRSKLTKSAAVTELDFTAYDIIYLAGGWGAAFDFGQSEELGNRLSLAYTANRVVGGICHGPLGLLKARKPNGEPLVKGLKLTAVTDRQVQQLGVSITPLHPESALRAAGANFECVHHSIRDFFANHYVVDGNVVTGQNQNAGPMVARLMMQRLLDQRRNDIQAGVAEASLNSAIN